jgi:hypothetical protein
MPRLTKVAARSSDDRDPASNADVHVATLWSEDDETRADSKQLRAAPSLMTVSAAQDPVVIAPETVRARKEIPLKRRATSHLSVLPRDRYAYGFGHCTSFDWLMTIMSIQIHCCSDLSGDRPEPA